MSIKQGACERVKQLKNRGHDSQDEDENNRFETFLLEPGEDHYLFTIPHISFLKKQTNKDF